jgi:hypothetical protein
VAGVAAPEYVPQPAIRRTRSYVSPPRRPESWRADRPGDLAGRQPLGAGLGSPGPDQGYIFVLARQYEGRLQLAAGEHEADAVAGCAGVALKRASIFGRAPVLPDLTVAFTLWGFLSAAPDELVELRRPLFAEAANAHHYGERRRIVDAVPESTLRKSPPETAEAHQRDWRSLLTLP